MALTESEILAIAKEPCGNGVVELPLQAVLLSLDDGRKVPLGLFKVCITAGVAAHERYGPENSDDREDSHTLTFPMTRS